MWATASRLRSLWFEGLWALFAAAGVAAVLLVEGGETVPFHLIWISLTLVYGFRLWPLRVALGVLGCVTVVSGTALTWVVAGTQAGLDEATEVPLMAAMFLAMVWHVERRQEAMREVQRVAERELQLERERNLVRSASHDLRTPISVARGHAELIRSQHVGEQTAEDAQIVVDQLDRLSRISERLLILAAAEHPAFLNRSTVELERIVNDAAKRWSVTASRRWRVEVEDEGILVADEERLSHCLDALVENAVKFTDEDGEITIVGRADGGSAVIEVSDTGDGIAEDYLPRIFERFSRADQGRGRSGTGLGLAIVKAIAEAHGGCVHVRSELGAGATFVVRLPGFTPASPESAKDGPRRVPLMPDARVAR